MVGRVKDLAYWINEREYMRIRKEYGDAERPGVYSPDPNMSGVRYCNVHREDDRVTRWIAENWRTPHADDPLLTLGMVAARMINWPPTLDEIGFPHGNWDVWATGAKAVMRNRAARGHKIWTSAYTISTCGRRIQKEDYVFDHVLAQVASRSWFASGYDLDGYFRQLTSVDGLGSFLAGQVIADLKNTPGHPLSNAPDFWEWSAPGPGSLRGLQAYWGDTFGRKITASNYHVAVGACYNEVVTQIGEHVARIHMQDFQNCLCEFSKYIRMKEGDGRVRNTYPGR